MTIGIDASRANREFKTGTEWYSYHVLKNLLAIDNHNRYLWYSDRPFRPELGEIIKQYKNVRGKVLAWPLVYLWTIIRLSLEMLFHRPKILFVPAHVLPLIHPRRTLLTIHDIAFKREKSVYIEPLTSPEKRWIKNIAILFCKYISLFRGRHFVYDPTTYLNWSTRYGLRHAKKIIAVSQATKDELVAVYQVRPDKVAVVHNGYDRQSYYPIKASEKIKKVLSKHDLNFPYLLYVGRLEKKKNIPLLVEAFALLKENHPEIKEKLVLVGLAGYGYNEVKYIIEEYNLNAEVIILGWLEEEDLPAIHCGARAFVFPSRHEGFGIPVLQALACALPTLVSDLPVFREIVGESVLYFDKDDKMDLAEKMYRLLSDGNLRRSLREKGLVKAKSFSWEKCAEETLRVMESMVE